MLPPKSVLLTMDVYCSSYLPVFDQFIESLDSANWHLQMFSIPRKSISLFSVITRSYDNIPFVPVLKLSLCSLMLAATLWSDPWDSLCLRVSTAVDFPAGIWPMLTIPPVQPSTHVDMNTCVYEWVSVFKHVWAYYLLISQVGSTAVDCNDNSKNVFQGVTVGRVGKWAMFSLIPRPNISSLTNEATWIPPSGSTLYHS